MILRPTKIEDISRVIDIINQAKTYFKNNDIVSGINGFFIRNTELETNVSDEHTIYFN